MSREEAKALYANKLFYIKNPDGTLDGPRDDIYYTVRTDGKTDIDEYKFVQVINGKPVQAFKEEEIVVIIEGERQNVQ